MDKTAYQMLERHMLACMRDSAHDKEHIYRVLYAALDIAGHEPEADLDILIPACILHDIGRELQYANPDICHAAAGGEMAEEFLLENGYHKESARHIRECIATHRYRSENPPASIEAKILFDADKLDATGTLGIARTLLYNGIVGEPLYSLDENRALLGGETDEPESFFKEWHYKLKKLYNGFYTGRGKELAAERNDAASCFFESMKSEVNQMYTTGQVVLETAIN